jgi:hypothetical protein
MNNHADYITDWYMPNNDLRTDATVAVEHKSKKVGLYRVKGVGRGTMTLSHGGISFPVGTQLVVDDFQKLVPNASKSMAVRVVENNRQGIQIAW